MTCAAVERHLRAGDRPHAEVLRRVRELERAVDAVVVGERERRVAELGRAGGELLRLRCPVEERVRRVRVELDVRGRSVLPSSLTKISSLGPPRPGGSAAGRSVGLFNPGPAGGRVEFHLRGGVVARPDPTPPPGPGEGRKETELPGLRYVSRPRPPACRAGVPLAPRAAREVWPLPRPSRAKEEEGNWQSPPAASPLYDVQLPVSIFHTCRRRRAHPLQDTSAHMDGRPLRGSAMRPPSWQRSAQRRSTDDARATTVAYYPVQAERSRVRPGSSAG